MEKQNIMTKPEAAKAASKEHEKLTKSIYSLLNYCKENDWAGFDPYDALNSRLFNNTPFAKSRICRIAITQILKRLPINIRPFILISKEQNSKAIALFLSSIVKLSRLGLLDDTFLVGEMIEKLEALRSPESSYWCWGYSFPWQTRKPLVPKGYPNLVCTVFVANALLDAYEYNHDQKCLDMAHNASEYILNELYWVSGTNSGFSYPLPNLKSRTHNANFLGAALFCRIAKQSGEKKFLDPALKVTRYSAERQYENGSWDYGDDAKYRWVDNFHTGYNLCALNDINKYTQTTEFEPYIRKGYEFYLNHFFREDGAPKYFHNRTYPIDIHSVAQSIITLVALRNFNENRIGQAYDVFNWSMENLWSSEGYFYYHIQPFFKNRLPYMRWSEAWMLSALATLLEYTSITSR